jgi:hypothetical protein
MARRNETIREGNQVRCLLVSNVHGVVVNISRGIKEFGVQRGLELIGERVVFRCISRFAENRGHFREPARFG